MPILDLKKDGPAAAVNAAWHGAANFVAILIGPDADSLSWVGCGASLNAENRDRARDALAAFVRAGATAPAEALYRFASAWGFHACDVDGFAALDLPYRIAFAAFRDAVIGADRLIAEEIGRLAALEQAAAGPIPAAALSEKPEDTILGLVPDPLEKKGGDFPIVYVDPPAGFRAPPPEPEEEAPAAAEADAEAEKAAEDAKAALETNGPEADAPRAA
jgi:hypothetical protein